MQDLQASRPPEGDIFTLLEAPVAPTGENTTPEGTPPDPLAQLESTPTAPETGTTDAETAAPAASPTEGTPQPPAEPAPTPEKPATGDDDLADLPAPDVDGLTEAQKAEVQERISAYHAGWHRKTAKLADERKALQAQTEALNAEREVVAAMKPLQSLLQQAPDLEEAVVELIRRHQAGKPLRFADGESGAQPETGGDNPPDPDDDRYYDRSDNFDKAAYNRDLLAWAGQRGQRTATQPAQQRQVAQAPQQAPQQRTVLSALQPQQAGGAEQVTREQLAAVFHAFVSERELTPDDAKAFAAYANEKRIAPTSLALGFEAFNAQRELQATRAAAERAKALAARQKASGASGRGIPNGGQMRSSGQPQAAAKDPFDYIESRR